MLDLTVAAVKSLLRRARARLADVPLVDEDLAEPADQGARRVLDRYMMAFRQSDMAAIERLLADDAVLEMTGTGTWFSGKLTCVPFIAAQAIGRSGDWEMLPLVANGQLGAAAYHRGDDRTYHSFAVVVLATTSDAHHAHFPVLRQQYVVLPCCPRPLLRIAGGEQGNTP